MNSYCSSRWKTTKIFNFRIRDNKGSLLNDFFCDLKPMLLRHLKYHVTEIFEVASWVSY